METNADCPKIHTEDNTQSGQDVEICCLNQ